MNKTQSRIPSIARNVIHLILFMSMCLSSFTLMAQNSQAASELRRVVSIDGGITEIIYALNMERALVGVDTTSNYPEAAKQLPSVGYMRHLSPEGILSLKPNLVLASAGAGPVEVLSQLKEAGLEVHIITGDKTLQGIYDRITQVADILNVEAQGKEVIKELKHQIHPIQRKLSEQSLKISKPKVMFLLSAGDRGIMLAGKNTGADALISMMGGQNIAGGFNSYKPLTPEGALQTNPDIIVIANTQGGESQSVLKEHVLLQHTSAAKNNKVIRADSMLLLSFGPRIAQAMKILAPVFYASPK